MPTVATPPIKLKLIFVQEGVPEVRPDVADPIVYAATVLPAE